VECCEKRMQLHMASLDLVIAAIKVARGRAELERAALEGA